MQQQKRTSNHLSPRSNDVQKRYHWEPKTLLEQNKYYLLNSQSTEPKEAAATTEEGEQTNDDITDTLNPPKAVKIPPIFLHGQHNHKEVIDDINQITNSEYTTTYTTKALKINLTSVEDYRELAKHYTDNNIQYHTYRSPDSKPLSVAIKNVPLSLEILDIQTELNKYSLPILKITRLYYKDKTPMPVCIVDLQATEKATEIFKINKLGNSIIKIEPRKITKDIPQCHRCQRLGHTKNYCKLEPRCIKCAGNHLSTECLKGRNEPPTCANCQEEHPANYRGCKAFQEPQYNNKTRITSQANPPPTNSRTYASATRNTPTPPSQQSPINPTPQSPSSINTILSSILSLIEPYLEQIKTFIINNVIPMFFNGP